MDRSGALDRLAAVVAAFAAQHLPDHSRWCVALSGGPDSLALTAAAARLRPTVALIVDHRLQPGSDQVAHLAGVQAMELGCVAARILPVSVPGPEFRGGVEAAARSARYAALTEARGTDPVLLGHTLDDQAETVLLGLGRGSGPRSLAGMRAYDPPWCRPLLGVRREVTQHACAQLGITPWRDPHNSDPRFVRARLRAEVLPLLEDVLGGGVAEALARTAIALREHTEWVDALADAALADAALADPGRPAGPGALDVQVVAGLAGPVRREVIRRWLLAGGARGLTNLQIRAVERLVTHWHGQGGVAVGSHLRGQRLVAARGDGRLHWQREPI